MTLPILYTEDTLASTQILCGYVWEYRLLWRVLLTGGAASTVKEEYLRQALNLSAVDQNTDTWIPPELSVTFAITAAIEILAWWLKQESPASAQ